MPKNQYYFLDCFLFLDQDKVAKAESIMILILCPTLLGKYFQNL